MKIGLARLKEKLESLATPAVLSRPDEGPANLGEARACGKYEGLMEAIRLLDELQHGYGWAAIKTCDKPSAEGS